ncbi:hypothetical protein [uncultured Kordia sp.]|uniref:hypothetical protein n=1 Tax=uncultured Kordia sp. TaxID=507699 RepID=UPI002602A038|nr:hypothetical protein [uncultured Kordia sp.]
MAVFKAIEKKASAVRKAIRNAELIVKNLGVALTALSVFLKSIQTLLTLSRRALIFIRKIIGAINSVLKRVGRFAGPLKAIIKPLRVILNVLSKALSQFQKLITAFNKAVKDLKLVLKYNGGARFLQKLLGKLLKKLRKKAEEVEELAKLLEKQQKWLEKILPPAFIKRLWDLVKAITKPLDSITKLTKKILDALLAFTKKLLGLQRIVDDLKSQFDFLNDWLKEIEKVTDTVNWIIKEIENAIKKIPGARFIIDILKFIGGIIDFIIEKSRIKDLLKFVLDKTGILDALVNGLNQIIGAIAGLIKDFKAIIDDIKQLLKDIKDLLGILTNLSGLLRLIALLKWFFGFRIPFRLRELENGLRWLQDPNQAIPYISTQNNIRTRVDAITIKGKGIGNDWNFDFTIGDQSQGIVVDRKGNRATKVNVFIADETVSNAAAAITTELKIVAVENDPTFDDFGTFTQVIQLENKPQEAQQQVEFTVNASGGDAGATAVITVQLSFVVESVEDVLIPLSELGRENEAINYLEHTLENLKSDIGRFDMAPGLLAQQHGVHQFVNTADHLLNGIKNSIVNGQDISADVEQFLGFIAESRTNLVPVEEMNFDPSYFIELFENSKLEECTAIITDILDFEDEPIVEDTDSGIIFEDEDLLKPILTTDIIDRPFDLGDSFDITQFIRFEDGSSLDS